LYFVVVPKQKDLRFNNKPKIIITIYNTYHLYLVDKLKISHMTHVIKI